MLLLGAAVLIAPGLAADAVCPAPVSTLSWAAILDQSEAAYADLDEAAFDAAMQAAAGALPCLESVVPPPLAARYHRLVGLRRYARQDAEGARLAFAAGNAVDPYGALPSDLLPPGHEGRRLAEGARVPGATSKVPAPASGALWFDGTVTRERPSDRPTLLQVETGKHTVDTRYLDAGAPMPVYPTARSRSVRIGLACGAGALGVAAGVLYGFAADGQATLNGPLPATEWDRDDVLALQARTNGLVVSSAVTAALGAVTLGATLVRW